MHDDDFRGCFEDEASHARHNGWESARASRRRIVTRPGGNVLVRTAALKLHWLCRRNFQGSDGQCDVSDLNLAIPRPDQDYAHKN